jgi:uncharacterized protein
VNGRAILIPESLAEALRLLQARAGLSRDDLARAAGVSSGSMSHYLNQVSLPPVAVLSKLTAVFARRLEVNSTMLWAEFGGLLEDGGRDKEPRTERQDLARRLDEALTLGDEEALLGLHTPDIVVHVPGRGGLSGRYEGEAGFQEFLKRFREKSGGSVRFDTHDVLANNEHTVLLQSLVATKQGKRLSSNTVVVCHLREGLIAELWMYPEDQHTSDEFWS